MLNYEQIFSSPAPDALGNLDTFITQNTDQLVRSEDNGATTGSSAFSLVAILFGVYLLGVAFIIIRNLYSHLYVYYLILKGEKVDRKEQGYILIKHTKDISPFSWGKYVILSKSDYQNNGELIVKHELAHIKLHHSYDIFISNILLAVQWYNPVIWLMKKELQDLHEFQADNYVLHSGVSAKEYQLLLIKKVAGAKKFKLITDSFDSSNLKKRIIMMKKSKSKTISALSYMLIIPLTYIMFIACSNTKSLETNQDTGKKTEVNPQELSKQIIGKWRLVGSNMSLRAGAPRIKIITEDTFSWIQYDEEGNEIAGGSGKYTLKDNVYTETIQSAIGPFMQEQIGNKATFVLSVKGNSLFQSGYLDNTYTTQEEWIRITED